MIEIYIYFILFLQQHYKSRAQEFFFFPPTGILIFPVCWVFIFILRIYCYAVLFMHVAVVH